MASIITDVARQEVQSDDRFNRHDAALILGIATCLLAYLLLISAPDPLYRWFHRDGYQLVDADVDPPAPPPFFSRYVGVRIVETGEQLSVPTSAFESPLRSGRRKVFFNRRAHLWLFGATAFDERVTTRSRSASDGFGPLVAGVLTALGGIALLRYGYYEKPAERRRRRRRR